jgi:hypothetical protein
MIHPLAVAIRASITDPIKPLVLFAGIRRKNEILEIFLYYLFLVGTDTGKEKRTHSYEQNSIFGSRNEWVTIAEFAASWLHLPSKASRHNILFSVGLSPLGVPIHPARGKRSMLSTRRKD